MQVIKSLFEKPVTNFKGKYYDMQGTVCAPKPLQAKLPIWIGGRGPKRTPRMAAQYADGFNVAYVPPEELQQLPAASTQPAKSSDVIPPP